MPLIVLVHLASDAVLRAAGTLPEDKEVVAGWTAFAIFLLLLVAVGLLGWSLTRHLRRVQTNREAGVFGPEGVPDVIEQQDAETGQRPGSSGPSASAT